MLAETKYADIHLDPEVYTVLLVCGDLIVGIRSDTEASPVRLYGLWDGSFQMRIGWQDSPTTYIPSSAEVPDAVRRNFVGRGHKL